MRPSLVPNGFTPRRVLLAASLTACLTSACQEITVPAYNSATVDQLTESPTAKVVNGAVLGMLAGARGDVPNHARVLGMLGREILLLDVSNPGVLRWLTGPMTQTQDQGDVGWSATYRQLRNGYTILDVVDRVTTYTPEAREGVRGVTKTFMAMALIDQLRVRDTFGLVIDIDVRGKTIYPFVSRDSGYARAAQLLDEATAHLAAAGSAFPFALTTGFTGLNTPATFVRFTWAIRARLATYRARWSDVLAALGQSFISTPATGASAALNQGAFNIYPSGETTNGMFQTTPTTLIGMPSFLTEAQRRADGSLDLRASSKAQVTSTTLSLEGVTSNVKITAYASGNANVPIIRNEELVLIRAEAHLALGDRAAAISDLNYVRVNAGGLAALPANYSGDLVTEILYNRRYSLFFEYGHRWADMRRYGRLDQLEKMLPSHRIFPLIPLPQQECLARRNEPKGCVTVEGF